MPPYESVIFLPAEANFVQSTMFAFSQNQAVGSESDQGSVGPVSKPEIVLALSILSKVRIQISQVVKVAIVFTEQAAQLMVYLYNKYLQCHGKPQGDLDWTYYIRFDTNTQALIQNTMVKLGSLPTIAPGQIFPASGPNPFPYL